MAKIINAIQAAMAKKQWSAERLAKESGVGRNAIYRFLAGKQDMRAANLDKVFKALGLDLHLP